MLERAPSLHLVLSSLLFSKLEEQEIRKKERKTRWLETLLSLRFKTQWHGPLLKSHGPCASSHLQKYVPSDKSHKLLFAALYFLIPQRKNANLSLREINLVKQLWEGNVNECPFFAGNWVYGAAGEKHTVHCAPALHAPIRAKPFIIQRWTCAPFWTEFVHFMCSCSFSLL